MDTTPLRPGRRTTTRYLPVREIALNLVWYRRYELGGTRIYTELPTPPDEAELVRSPDAPVFAAS
jgi:hypothetical protein